MSTIGISEPATQPQLERFFSEIGRRLVVPASSPTLSPAAPPVEMPEVKDFFSAAGHVIEAAEARQRKADRLQASRFNVFDLIEPDENKLSDILADLLDPQGRHGQGDRFLRLLFDRIGLGAADLGGIAQAKVQREAPTHGIQKYRRRLDVLIDAGVLVAIENKVDSWEQPEQVKDYLEHLCDCSRGRAIPGRLIYLTPNGRRPESLSLAACCEEEKQQRLFCWSYQRELRQWLEACRAACQAEKIRWFITDFIAYIETKLLREPEPDEEEGAQ